MTEKDEFVNLCSECSELEEVHICNKHACCLCVCDKCGKPFNKHS